MFGRATITLSIGPHSKLQLNYQFNCTNFRGVDDRHELVENCLHNSFVVQNIDSIRCILVKSVHVDGSAEQSVTQTSVAGVSIVVKLLRRRITIHRHAIWFRRPVQ